jgi:hypothetical protein
VEKVIAILCWNSLSHSLKNTFDLKTNQKNIAKIFIDLSLGIVQYKKTKIILRIITQNKAVKLSLKKGNNLVHLNVAYDFQYISLKSLNYL